MASGARTPPPAREAGARAFERGPATPIGLAVLVSLDRLTYAELEMRQIGWTNTCEELERRTGSRTIGILCMESTRR